MRKVLGFILPLLVLVTLVVTVRALERGHTPGWEAELSKYVTYKNLASGDLAVRRVVQARKPWNFEPTLTSATYGESPYYQTAYAYNKKQTSTSKPPSSLAGETPRDNRKPLPFPPQDVRCVLLEKAPDANRKAEKSYDVVFVALHQDMYNADWVTHEAAGDFASQEVRESLSRIGCNL